MAFDPDPNLDDSDERGNQEDSSWDDFREGDLGLRHQKTQRLQPISDPQ